MKKKKGKVMILIALVIIMIIWILWGNNSIVITNIQYSNRKIPSEFSGYTIVQISDLHNKQFGKNQTKLLNKIKKCNPDIIVVTGDLIDKRRYSLDIAIEFIDDAVTIAPVYYVSGNHEAYTKEYEQIKKKLIESNVIVLDNESVTISKNEQTISLIGILDPNFYPYSEEDRASKVNNELEQLSNNDYFKILLSHRPEFMDIYSNHNIDLAFTGHAHGGQIRIPLIGGIVAPNQGFFPQYIDGTYIKNHTTMVVSRGLGASIIPIRIWNRPEVIKVVLTNLFV